MGNKMELKQVLTDIARAIVDNPDAVNVEETVNGDDIEFVLTVAHFHSFAVFVV